MLVTPLSMILVVKIVVTLAFVGLPFLILPKSRLEVFAGVSAETDTFFRLYGIAIIALLLGYATAFPVLAAGQFPWGVATMGVVSNGGAALILFRSGNGIAKRYFLPIYAAICLALIVSMSLPERAIAPLIS